MLDPAPRKFTVDFDRQEDASPTPSVPNEEKGSSLAEFVRQNVIGDQEMIRTVFGEKPLVYADNAASGRSLKFIEDYLTQNVLPHYANTHTTTSLTGRQTTLFRQV
jgi:selenocysteine lyase/cysteine desulfurase